MVRNASIAASFVAAKKSFSRRFAWSRRHNFRICGISIDPGHRRWCFWRGQRAVWAISRSRHQLRSRRRSIICDRVNVNKPKLRNFDRPLGLPGHLQWSFWRRHRVISSKYDGAGLRVHSNCCYRQPPNNSRDPTDVNRRKCGKYTRYLWNFDGPLGLSGRRRQCFWRRQRVNYSKNDGASPW